MREAENLPAARLREGIERRSFHLDRKNASLDCRFDRFLRFPKGSIGRPCGPDLRCNLGPGKRMLRMSDQLRIRLTVI